MAEGRYSGNLRVWVAFKWCYAAIAVFSLAWGLNADLLRSEDQRTHKQS